MQLLLSHYSGKLEKYNRKKKISQHAAGVKSKLTFFPIPTHSKHRKMFKYIILIILVRIFIVNINYIPFWYYDWYRLIKKTLHGHHIK